MYHHNHMRHLRYLILHIHRIHLQQASPPHTPAQSVSIKQLPAQSKLFSAAVSPQPQPKSTLPLQSHSPSGFPEPPHTPHSSSTYSLRRIFCHYNNYLIITFASLSSIQPHKACCPNAVLCIIHYYTSCHKYIAISMSSVLHIYQTDSTLHNTSHKTYSQNLLH